MKQIDKTPLVQLLEIYESSLILHRKLKTTLETMGYKKYTLHEFAHPGNAAINQKIIDKLGPKSYKELIKVIDCAKTHHAVEHINPHNLTLLEFAILYKGMRTVIIQLKNLEKNGIKLMKVRDFIALAQEGKAHLQNHTKLSDVAILDLRRLITQHLESHA